MESGKTRAGYGEMPDDEQSRDTIPDMQFYQEQDPKKTQAGFEQVPDRDTDAGHRKKDDMRNVMIGVDVRKMAYEQMRKAQEAGDEETARKMREYIQTMEDNSKRAKESPPAPRAAMPEPKNPQEYHEVRHKVQMFGPEVQDQIRAAREQAENDKKKKKGIWKRLLGR